VFDAIGIVLLGLGQRQRFRSGKRERCPSGHHQDQSDAAIKGTKVAITSKDQGWTRSTETMTPGFYSFELLPAGIYSVKVNASGFNTAEAKEVCYRLARRRRRTSRSAWLGVRDHRSYQRSSSSGPAEDGRQHEHYAATDPGNCR